MFEILGVLFLLDFIIGSCEGHEIQRVACRQCGHMEKSPMIYGSVGGAISGSRGAGFYGSTSG